MLPDGRAIPESSGKGLRFPVMCLASTCDPRYVVATPTVGQWTAGAAGSGRRSHPEEVNGELHGQPSEARRGSRAAGEPALTGRRHQREPDRGETGSLERAPVRPARASSNRGVVPRLRRGDRVRQPNGKGPEPGDMFLLCRGRAPAARKGRDEARRDLLQGPGAAARAWNQVAGSLGGGAVGCGGGTLLCRSP